MSATNRPRPREVGIRIGSLRTGRWNAITDVPDVRVGQVTVWHGDGSLRPGSGPARTGVTTVLPHGGNLFRSRVPAAYYQFNGFGKTIGIEQLDELGVLETPIALTSTLCVGRVADALITHAIANDPEIGIDLPTVNPFVAECNDSWLNDAQGRHVRERHVLESIRLATAGPVAGGSVGAGTGMSAFGHKGGIGTASRRVEADTGDWTVGVLVLANFGTADQLVIDGVPFGKAMHRRTSDEFESGSVVVVVATDAPLLDRALKRLARRAVIGLGRTGSMGGHGSGDIVVAFSSSPLVRRSYPADLALVSVTMIDDDGPDADGRAMNLLFQGVVEATEESVLDALFRATTVAGRDGHVRRALEIDDVIASMRSLGRG